MKKIFFFLLILALSVAACDTGSLENVSEEDIQQVSENLIVCDEPYIRVGSECCLDEDSNNICDRDETEEDLKNETMIENSSNELKEENEENKSQEESLRKNTRLTFEEGDNKFKFNNKEYNLEIEGITREGLFGVRFNSEFDGIIYPYEESEFNNLYLYVTDIVYSPRDSVKSYGEAIISNYQYTLQAGDVKCIDTDETQEEKGTTYGLSSNKTIMIEEDYCENDNQVVDYYCTDSQKVMSKTIECELGCDSGACKDTSEISCNKDPLESGKKTFEKNDSISLNKHNLTIIDVGDDAIEIKINGESKYLEPCTIEEFGDLSLLIHKVVSSERPDVQSYFEMSYEYNQEDFNETKIITLGGGETSKIQIGTNKYELSLGIIFTEAISEIKVNDDRKGSVNIYDQVSIGGLSIQTLENIVSTRPSVKSFSRFIVGNYDYELNSNLTNGVTCYEYKKGTDEKNTVFATFSNHNFEKKDSYCSSNSTLNHYSCDGPNDSVIEEEVSCQYGCEQGRCLSIVDVGCDKEELASGSIILGENESYYLDNSTMFRTIAIGGQGSVLLDLNHTWQSVKMCREKVLEGTNKTILIHQVYPSERESVKGYFNFSYE